MKIMQALRILLIFIFWIFNKYAKGSSSTTEDTISGSKGFSCAGKVIGGYYADVQEKCQMFHVCTIGENGEIRDIVFRCLNGTVFDQETRVCEREEEVNCPIAQSFFHLNNDLYGPGIIPETANALKHALGQTHRQITVLKSDTVTTTRDANSLCSGIANAASLVVDVENGCHLLHLCVPQQNQGYAVQTFVCDDENHAFDPMTKLCTKKQSVQCNSDQRSSSSSFKEAQFFSTYLLNLCPLFPPASLMVDSLSGCEQYFQCPSVQYNNEPIVMRRCPLGSLFSQVDQVCVPSDSMVCSRDLYSLLKLFELKSSGLLEDKTYKQINIKSLGKVKKNLNNINNIPEIPLVSRKKRAFSFEDRNFNRELASGSLTNSAGIFSDHVSVIEAQGPGNVLEGKINNPKFPLRDDQTGNNSNQPANDLRYKKEKSVAPETSLELNKTVLNGTTIEVSKIASAKNAGEVTITSIVPKLVRHNGNGHKTERSDDEVSSPNPTIISNGKTKITLLGSSHGKSEEKEETIIEQPEPTNSTLDSEVTDKAERDTSIQTEVPEKSEAESATDMITDAVPSETTVVDVITTEKPQEQTTISTTVTTTTTTTPPPTTTTTTTTTTTAPTTTTSTTTTTISTTSVQPEISTKEEKVATNFTCKDKELEKFYPDIERDCKLFHYCSPGFSENEVLDLTFVCSNDTMFDVRTSKCQDMSTVICGEPIPTTTTTTTTASTTTSEASSSSAETTVSSSTTTVAASSTSTLEATTASELPVSSSTNVQTVSEAVEDSTMTLTSSSEGLELSSISTVNEDPKSDSTESIIPDEEGLTISGDLKSEKIDESDPQVTVSGTDKRSPSDGITSEIISSDSSIITEMVTEGSEKDQEISSTDPSNSLGHTETIIDNSSNINASSDDSKIKNNEESSTIITDEKVSENISASDSDTNSSLFSTTDNTPEGTEISNLDPGTSTK